MQLRMIQINDNTEAQCKVKKNVPGSRQLCLIRHSEYFLPIQRNQPFTNGSSEKLTKRKNMNYQQLQQTRLSSVMVKTKTKYYHLKPSSKILVIGLQ